MNRQIKKLVTTAVIIILLLFGATTYEQFFNANKLKQDPRNSRTYFETFNNNRGPIVVDGKQIAYSTEANDDYGYLRHYKDGKIYAPITGFYSILYGMSGLENYANEYLMGKSSSFSILNLENLFTGRKPQGGIVETTISKDAQEAAYNALGSQKGAVVAIDPTNGEIKALVSTDSYDPNLLATHNTKSAQSNYNKLINAKGNPMLSKPTEQLYAPGSTFKLITSAAALETKKYKPSTKISAPNSYKLPNSNKVLKNMYGESCGYSGKISLTQALDVSCNTAFAKLGVKIGQKRLYEQAKKFGFEHKFEIPTRVVSSVFPQNMDDSQTAMSAIGQYNVKETVLQNALVLSAIDNDGIIMTPHLIKTVRTKDLQIVKQIAPTVYNSAISSETANYLKKMMVSVAKNGTGRVANISGAVVGAKTGTAEKVKGVKPNNWFVSFVNKGDKHLVVAVLVESGGNLGFSGTGAGVAGPIAKKVMQSYLASD